MHVVVNVSGQVKVDDVGDVGDVQATGSHIGGHKHRGAARAEAAQRLRSRMRVEVAGQGQNNGTMQGRCALCGSCAAPAGRIGKVRVLFRGWNAPKCAHASSKRGSRRHSGSARSAQGSKTTHTASRSACERSP